MLFQMNNFVYISIVCSGFSFVTGTFLCCLYNKIKNLNYLKSSIVYRVLYLSFFLMILAYFCFWGHMYVIKNTQESFLYFYVILFSCLVFAFIFTRKATVHIIRLLFSVNLLTKAVYGHRTIKKPIYEFVFRNKLDWAIIIGASMTVWAAVSSEQRVFLYPKIFLACVVLSSVIFFIFRYKKYLEEERIFQNVTPISKRLATFSSRKEINDGIEKVVNGGHFDLLEQLVKELPVFFQIFIELVKEKGKQFEVEATRFGDFLDENIADEKVQQMIRKTEKFYPLIHNAREVGGLPNYFVLALSLNKFRRIESKYYDLYRLLLLVLVSTLMFFVLHAVDLLTCGTC